MKPSKYQNNIFKFIKSGKGNCIIQAVAGSGKTTTIIHSTKLIPQDKDSLFVAFNKAIADELKTRLPSNIKSSTLHSLGLSMFQPNTNVRPEIKYDKLQNTINAILKENGFEEDSEEFNCYSYFLKRVTPLVKATLTKTNFSELDALLSQYNIDWEVDDKSIRLLEKVLFACKQNTKFIDFDDMIWIPIVNNFYSKTYNYVFIDETQDLNKSQLELIKKVCNKDTRVIAVGDRKQSIYAFRGANTNSMDDVKEFFEAVELPLSICYRCAKNVVKLAQTIVPNIEYSEDKEDGIVNWIDYNSIIKKAKDGDLILCRTNAPLVKVAFSLIREGKKAVIRGRDIGKNLIKIIDRYDCNNLNDLIEKINNYKNLQDEKLMLIEAGKYDKNKKAQLMMLVDSCDTITIIASEVNNIEELKLKIESIFSDDRVGIVCSSVHKAKGLEANNVFIINWDMMPHPMAKTDEEVEQEYNIKYVAVTRAKKELYLLHNIDNEEEVIEEKEVLK